MIGAGSAVWSQLALVLAVGQVLADIPEGFAVVANFREKVMQRRKRVLVSASFVFPVIGSALASYFALKGQSKAIQMAALVFVAGLYSLAAVEDMLREAHENAEDSRLSAARFVASFALFLRICA